MVRKQLAFLLLAASSASVADARLTRLFVTSQEDVAPARPDAPAYRIMRGHYDGEVDPVDARNRIITDLSSAPRLANGHVAYSATFAIALPADPARTNGFLWYDVPNRGNGSVTADPDGAIRVVSGWQGDLTPQPGAQTLEVPVARGHDGPLTGPVLQRFTDVPAGTRSVAITGSIGRPTARPLPVSLDTHRAQLFNQASDSAALVAVAARDWAFADCRDGPFPGRPDPTQLCLRGGFKPATAYTLTYQGRDSKVLGLGFAAVRDFNAFLRYAARDDAGTPNPVAGLVRWPIITGTSQSGNFVRSLIALGFNASEDGRRVFDGANPNIAARQVPLNIRFGVPGGAAGLFEPGSEGALWWSRYDDRARDRGVSSLLDRCRVDDTCPRIIETFGSAEFWGLRMSPNLVGTDARADLPLPLEVRRYYFPGTTHGGSSIGGFPPAGEKVPAGAPACLMAWNPNPSADTRRALLQALAEWVARGKEPPASRYPTLARGELVEPTAAAMNWPRIPGAPLPDGKLNAFLDYDFGPGFRYNDLSGVIARQPPAIRKVIPSLVPRVDRDGNEVGGVPSVQMLVPLGSYTGWNVQARGYGAGGGCGFVGGFVPFARTEAERRASGDPRPSLQSRYRDHAGFVAQVRRVAAEQVQQGWLLAPDAERLVKQAEQSDVLR
ncbi:alpha/beta hydrolase domain-containing protein [uncultured Sphingomonas sp.]|uniref:alpha/beta hydrolase domain-containing protein n=1 Tax=uncultured Sphingomonas sp. TaxID=158754 RepID=UPI0025F3FD61|nr:alpha/beta hydrolase domain-containing protein [uncultured Sphingomonas sp.]